ncbi:class I SAM-dependent methyltransferase [Nonomuraea sp. CA-218870]|uniref:class I SAM-dependent methyltransferase n=1 Tax=Nonomuraea sp. CA-218870 TaxID=3239998 RepID=UPI003D8F6F96
MPRVAHGARDEHGRWHANDLSLYPAMDVHGALPWSVLDATTSRWRERVAWWRGLGVDDTAARAHAAGMIATGRHGRISGGVSRFDPHLAEALYTWFCPPGGHVLDPCAGGPVRGLVAGHLGLHYTGVDLSAEQVRANRARGLEWERSALSQGGTVWVEGDAREVLPRLPGGYDYLLSCPPYHNRERYSDDPRDLSAMRWPGFVAAHAEMIAAAVRLLKEDRLATWVISDVRDHRGHLRGLPAHAVAAFEQAGCHLINEQVLVTPAGLLGKTMRPAWEAARTTTRRHQLVLTFVKGDRRKAAAAIRGADHAD